MNSNREEKVIDLKDMLYAICQKWRRVLCVALIIALLAALWQAFSGVRVMLSDEKMLDAQEKYAVKMSDYEATGERLRAQIDNLKEQSSRQQDYNSKSELMKIDPMNKWVGTFQLYIDSQYQIDPSLSFQNVDLTNRLISAYSSYLTSGGVYQEILERVDYLDEIRFLTEVYRVSSDPNTAIITVRCTGKSEADVRALAEIIKEKIDERSVTVSEAIGTHSHQVLTESFYPTIDLDLYDTQQANQLAVTNYANEIATSTDELSAWERKGQPGREFGAPYTVKQTIKYLIIGFVVGIVAAVVCYAIVYLCSSTLKTADDWRGLGLPVLGSITGDGRRHAMRKIDTLVDRIFGRADQGTMDQTCRLAAHTLAAAVKEQGQDQAALIGRLQNSLGGTIAKKMNDSAAGVQFAFAGDALADPDTAENMRQASEVVILAKQRSVHRQEAEQMLTLLKAWGKKVLGVMIVD